MVEEGLIEPQVKGFGVRHGQVILQFFFYIIIDGIKMSLSGTISSMRIAYQDGDNYWTSQMISWALGCYLLGFLITGLFGGWLCKKCGFKWPMVIAMVIILLVTFNLPTITDQYGYEGLMSCRLVQGLCSGLVYPMPADFISIWIPAHERTVLGTTIYASGKLGDVLGLFLSSFLTMRLGWASVYMLYGIVALVWAILMAIYGANSPEEYTKKISQEELNYILQNRGRAQTKTKVKIPWKQLVTSLPVWAIIVAQIGSIWLFNVISGNIIIFLYVYYGVGSKSVQDVNLIVLLISWIFTFIFSALAQLFIQERRTTIQKSRKIFNTIGCLIPAVIIILFLVLPAWNEYQGITFFVLLSVASVATIVGSKVNVNDISSNFAPIVFGTANWVGSLFTVIFTIIIGLSSLDRWIVLFIFTVILLVVTNTFYLKFGSGEEQCWESYQEMEDEESELSKSTSRVSNDEGKYLLFVKKQ